MGTQWKAFMIILCVTLCGAVALLFVSKVLAIIISICSLLGLLGGGIYWFLLRQVKYE